MKKHGSWFAAGALGFVALLASGCGVGGQGQRAQYASLQPANGSAADGVADPAGAARVNRTIPAAVPSEAVPSEPYRPVRLSVTKASPVQSLLEMRHHDVVIQTWDLSCGAAALATLLNYEWDDPVTEKQVANGLMGRREYVENPQLVQIREGFSLLDLKRYVQAHGFKGEGLGQLDFNDLLENAPIMVPVDALGYNHFVIFRGVYGGRVLLADPAWGNRTMTIDKFQRMWLDYGKPMGHVGFVVERTGAKPPNKLQPEPSDFVMLD
jgi:predicted double-glycine peptidase